MRFAIVFAVVACACSKSESPSAKAKPDAAELGEGEGEEVLNPDPTPVDPGPTPTDSGTGTGTDAGACTGKIVVNEIMPYGSAANDEFIELYNPSSCDVTLDGFKLSYKSSAGAPPTGSPLHAFAAGTIIKGKGYLVVGTTSFKGTKDATFNGGGVTVNGGMGNEGQVALLDAAGMKMDSVGYGAATGDYVEGKPAPKAPSTASIARRADGLDTDDNSKDFDWFTIPTPGAKNGV